MAERRVVEALERLVVGAVGLTTASLGRTGVASELTLPQWRALVVVARTDGVRVGEVAARVGVTLSSASRLIRRLERQGLVMTERDERDRRATIVRATPAGRITWEGLVEHRRQLIDGLLESLPKPLSDRLADELDDVAQAFARYA